MEHGEGGDSPSCFILVSGGSEITKFFQEVGFIGFKLGVIDYTWVSYSYYGQAFYSERFTRVLWEYGSTCFNRRSCGRIVEKGCCYAGFDPGRSRWFHISLTVSKEEVWQIPPLLGSTAYKCQHSVSEVPARRYQATQAHATRRRLYDIHRSTGWVPSCSDSGGVTEVAPVSMAVPILSVQSSTFRVIVGPMGFYKAATASASEGSESRDSSVGLPRRFYHLRLLSQGVLAKYGDCFAVTHGLGFSGQSRKVVFDAIHCNRIPGFHYRYCKNEVFRTCSKKEALPKRVCSTPEKAVSRSLSKAPYFCLYRGEASILVPSRSFLWVAPAGDHGNSQGVHEKPKKRVRFVGLIHPGDEPGSGGITMVGTVAPGMERTRDYSGSSQRRSVLRRIRIRVRRSHGNVERKMQAGSSRVLVQLREPEVVKLAGNYGRKEGGTGFFKVERSPPVYGASVHRQHCDLLLSRKDGRAPHPSEQGRIDFTPQVRRAGGDPHSGACTRRTELRRRPLVSHSLGPVRVAAKQERLQTPGLYVGPSHGGLVCDEKQQPASKVRYLDARRSGSLRGCFGALSKEGKRVCSPSVLDHWKSITKVGEINTRSYNYCTSMAQPVLVAPVITPAIRSTCSTSRFGELARSPSRVSGFSKKGPVANARLSDLRQVLEKKGIPAEVTQILGNRWAPSTQRNYGLFWRRWRMFCGGKGSDVFHPRESDVVKFLYSEFNRTNSSTAVNHAISALTSILELSTEKNPMQGPIVKMFRKSVNILRPAGPAADSTWDITAVLKFIKRMGNDENLDWSQLLLKVILLIRIDCFARASDLVKIFREEIKREEKALELRFLRPKEWRPEGRNSYREWSPWIKVLRANDPQVCLVRTLDEWLNRSSMVVKPVGGRLPLLCSSTGVPLTAKEISLHCAAAMREAGVDTAFKPQSIRGAAASAAIDWGASLKDVIKQGRWADKDMFLKYYYRKIPRRLPEKKRRNLQEIIRTGLYL